MGIRESRRRIGAERLGRLARQLLEASTLCAIATVSSRGGAHINTAYFAWSTAFDLVWLSEPHARHSRNLSATETVAIAVYDSNQTWGNSDRGIQLFGTAREVSGRATAHAERTYAERFPTYTESDFAAYRFYRFRPRRLKLFDETALGAGVFVTARVSRGEIAWERTDVYDARAP
jgi:uncharacterized protein YhbP (UPF0306 family)